MLSDRRNWNRIETELQSLRPNYKVCVLFLFLELSLCSSVHSDYKVVVSFLFLDILFCSRDHIPHQTEANCNVQAGGAIYKLGKRSKRNNKNNFLACFALRWAPALKIPWNFNHGHVEFGPLGWRMENRSENKTEHETRGKTKNTSPNNKTTTNTRTKTIVHIHESLGYRECIVCFYRTPAIVFIDIDTV